MSPENRNNLAEATPNDQMNLFGEFERIEIAADAPNPQTVDAITEKIRTSSQSKAELEQAIRESATTEERLVDQGVTNGLGARAMTGSEVSRQALEDIVDKEAAVEEYSSHSAVGGSPYLSGKSKPGYQRSKKRRYVSSRDRMLGDVAPEHIRRQRGH